MAQDRERILALQNRSFEFTCGVIDAYPKNSRIDDASRLIWRQLIKAASSATFTRGSRRGVERQRLSREDANRAPRGERITRRDSGARSMSARGVEGSRKLSRRSEATQLDLCEDHRQQEGEHETPSS